MAFQKFRNIFDSIAFDFTTHLYYLETSTNHHSITQ